MEKKNNYPPEGFTERLKDSWLKSGMSQKQVALKIGCDRKSIFNWMEGINIPDIRKLYYLCRLFNVSADYLLFGEEGENAVHTP